MLRGRLGVRSSGTLLVPMMVGLREKVVLVRMGSVFVGLALVV